MMITPGRIVISTESGHHFPCELREIKVWDSAQQLDHSIRMELVVRMTEADYFTSVGRGYHQPPVNRQLQAAPEQVDAVFVEEA